MPDTANDLLERALQARREDRLEDARRDLVKALEIFRSSGGESDSARTLKALGQIEREMGHADVALSLYEQAAAVYRAEGDALGLAHALRHAADIQQELGRDEAAEPLYREALAIYKSHSETTPLELANAVRGLAILTFDTGKSEEARALWTEARDLYASVNVQAGVNESSRRLILLASR